MKEVEALDEKRIERLAEDFTALSHPRRLRLLHMLTQPKYGEELSELLGTTRQNALKHVERLEERGFVRSMDGRRETGPVVEYQVVPQQLFALAVVLNDLGKLEPEGGPERTGLPPTLDDQVPQAARDGAGYQAAKARLLLLDGPEAGTALPLDEDGSRWRIGRKVDREISLQHDPYVSGHHAELHVAPAGHSLVDVHSANGTYVNFDRLPAGGRVLLKSGDVIRVGHSDLVYQQGP